MKSVRIIVLLTPLLLLLASCSSGDAPADLAPLTLSDMTVVRADPGSSPFTATLHLQGRSLPSVTRVRYTITPKEGSASRPVQVQYTLAALKRRNYTSTSSEELALPLFGLYADADNRVDVDFTFADGSMQTLPAIVSTPAFTDPNRTYDRLTINKPRGNAALGFDFFFMKSIYGYPVVVDTDGNIRWIGPAKVASGGGIAFRDNGFVLADWGSPQVFRFELDGTVTAAQLNSSIATNFHHNLDPGKTALLGAVDTLVNGVGNVESTVIELQADGSLLAQWDLAALIGDYMRSQGDDPGAFVRPGEDWFHSNAATYVASDDSLIVSSRENFVIKIDYRSGDIRWILGDPTKYWYTFPSLRAKALALADGSLAPIGQHSVSVTSDGLLLLFDNGTASLNQPAGAPAGASRTYSAVSAFAIDPAARIAREAWRFDYGQGIYSAFCSSAYEAPGQSLLVNYSLADNGAEARIVALDAGRNVVFDFSYPTRGCDTSWNAQTIPFEDLRFD